MLRTKQFLQSGYSVAVLSSLLGLLLRFALHPLLNEKAPLLVFICPIMFSAWYGGLRPGLLATLLCTLFGTYFFIPPYFSLGRLNISDSTRLSIFLIEGVFISWLSEALRAARRRSEIFAANLRVQEEQYRLLVEGVQDHAIFGMDATGYINSWTNGAVRVQGYTAAEILGQHFSIFYTGADLTLGKPEQALQVAATTGNFEEEGWRRRKNGTLFWASVVISALQDRNSLRGFTQIIRDISERKQIEDERKHSQQVLQDSYALLENIIEGTADAVFVKDRQGRYQLVNSTAARIFGRPRAEVLGKDDRELLNETSALALQQADQVVIETGRSQTLEEPIQAAGEQRIFLTTKDPLRDTQGKIIGLIGIGQDITKRKHAEEQQRRSAQRLEVLHRIDRAILKSESPAVITQAALMQLKTIIPVDQAAVVLWDLATQQGYVLAGEYANYRTDSTLPLAERVHFYSLQQPTRSLVELDQSGDRPVPVKYHIGADDHSLLAIAIQIDQALMGDLVLIAKQPQAFSPEHTEIAQEVADQLAIAIQQSRLRDQLQRYTEELEVRVAERTAALQEAIAGLELFNYSASHDLRAPLRVMEGLSEALLEDYGSQLDSTGQLYAQEIMASAQQAEQLVINLLEYGRLSRAEIHLQPLNLSEIVAQVLHQLTDQLQACNASVKVDHPLPEIMGHPATLNQAILNLITNAVKFMPSDRSAQVEIWTESRTGWVRIWIKDNGIGIAPEHQERIFQPFERLHTATAYPGTGVGLAIVRKGVERMGGRVGVESELGQGSRFWVELREANGV